MREIRTLRAMWRALETGLRQFLNGHDEGNLGYKPRRSLRAAAPVLDPTGLSIWRARLQVAQRHRSPSDGNAMERATSQHYRLWLTETTV